MAYEGDFRLGETFDVKFTTIDSTGAPITLAGTPAVSAYPGNSTTQITAGITLSVDFDSVTGLHNIRVVATSGNGYATATNYQLVLTAGTVDSVSVVGYVVGSFSIENRSALMPTTAARTLTVESDGMAHADVKEIEGSDATNQIRDAVVDDATRIDASALNTASTAIGSDGTGLTEAGGTGDHLTAINLPDQTMNITGDITGNLSGSVGSVTGAVGSVTAQVTANVTAISGDSGAADNLEAAFDDTAGAVRWTGIIDQGTLQAATATTAQLRAGASFADDRLIGMTIVITGGTGVGQSRVITDYVNATDTATVDTWTTTPSTDSTYQVLPSAPASTSAPAPVNVVQLSGDATAADNAEAFFDGTGYAGTGNTIPTVTNLTNAPTAGDLTATMKASVNTEVDSAIETYHLDHLLAATYDPASKPGAADALLNEMVESDGGVSRFTVNALENGPSGSGSSPEAIADEVQTRTIAAVTTVGSVTGAVGSVTGNVGGNVAGSVASVTGAVGSVTGNVGGNVVGSIGSLATQAKADVNAEADTALSDYDPPTRAELTSDIDGLPTAAENASTLLAATSNGLTVAQLLASGAMNISIAAGVLTVKYGDDTTAFTRTLTREELDAITVMAVP